jgi:hypothetical protein
MGGISWQAEPDYKAIDAHKAKSTILANIGKDDILGRGIAVTMDGDTKVFDSSPERRLGS